MDNREPIRIREERCRGAKPRGRVNRNELQHSCANRQEKAYRRVADNESNREQNRAMQVRPQKEYEERVNKTLCSDDCVADTDDKCDQGPEECALRRDFPSNE